MSASFYDLMKYAHTGLATADMTAFDKLRAQEMAGGGAIKTLTGVPPLSFKSNGKPLISWSMLGNSQQTGTPSPDNIIMPEFCGKLVGTDWIIPITNAGQTVPIHLGQTQTVRKVKKLVLTGEETVWYQSGSSAQFKLILTHQMMLPEASDIFWCCSHFVSISNDEWAQHGGQYSSFLSWHASDGSNGLRFKDTAFSTATDFKQWLADQYANGTPVIVWYILAEPVTGIVNEPLCKIGDYADELHSEDAGVSIPTAKGQNTLTVDTELQPSSMTITYR